MNVRAAPLGRAGLWRGFGWAIVAAVVVLSLVPLSGSAPFRWFDKVEHVAAYAFLMWWFAALAAADRRWRVALGMVALGAGVEVAQGFTGWRAMDVWDVAADAVGVGLGWAVATLTGPRIFLAVERLLGVPQP